MARGMPSMLALLGLVAMAGYQNRDKLAELLNGATGGNRNPNNPGGQEGGLGGLLGGQQSSFGGQQGGIGGLLGGLGGLLGGAAGGATLREGLGGLLDQFRESGHGDTADHWVKTGPDRGLSPEEVERAVGADNIAELSQRTGLSRDELLKRLATNLPEAVDKFTPDGRIPTDDEASRLL